MSEEVLGTVKIIAQHEEAIARQKRVVRRLSAIGADTTPARAVLKSLEEALAAIFRKSN